MAQLLLPQQIAPVDHRQSVMTSQHFGGETDRLHDYFLALRGEADGELGAALPPAGAKPYPYGRCEEITRAVFGRLAARLKRPSHPLEDTILAFSRSGGIVRTVWGALRRQYFQNALQLGALYVDVANDTVVVTKPKIEILPMAESGLEPLRDLEHFSEIAAVYWGASVYANTLVPSLAPILPLVTVSPGRLAPALQSASDYMIALMCRDGFRQAEAWLCDRPAPTPEIAAVILDTLPEDLHPKSADGRAEAIQACRRARAAAHTEDGPWRKDRVMDYLRWLAARADRGEVERLGA